MSAFGKLTFCKTKVSFFICLFIFLPNRAVSSVFIAYQSIPRSCPHQRNPTLLFGKDTKQGKERAGGDYFCPITYNVSNILVMGVKI